MQPSSSNKTYDNDSMLRTVRRQPQAPRKLKLKINRFVLPFEITYGADPPIAPHIAYNALMLQKSIAGFEKEKPGLLPILKVEYDPAKYIKVTYVTGVATKLEDSKMTFIHALRFTQQLLTGFKLLADNWIVCLQLRPGIILVQNVTGEPQYKTGLIGIWALNMGTEGSMRYRCPYINYDKLIKALIATPNYLEHWSPPKAPSFYTPDAIKEAISADAWSIGALTVEQLSKDEPKRFLLSKMGGEERVIAENWFKQPLETKTLQLSQHSEKYSWIFTPDIRDTLLKLLHKDMNVRLGMLYSHSSS